MAESDYSCTVICVYTMVLVVVVIVLLTRVGVLMPVTIPKRGGALSWRRHDAGVESDRGRVHAESTVRVNYRKNRDPSIIRSHTHKHTYIHSRVRRTRW